MSENAPSLVLGHKGKITFLPPPPKIQAIAVQKPKAPEKTAEEIAAETAAASIKAGKQQTGLLIIGGLVMLLIGTYAPVTFMQHFIVFVLACFVGFQVIWNVIPTAQGFDTLCFPRGI